MRDNPYFNFLKKDFNQTLMVFTLVVVINVGITTVSNIYMALEPSFDRQINFYSQASPMAAMMCFIMGIMFILMNFSGGISIRGDRAGFLKAFALWSIIMAVFMALFGTVFEMVMKSLTEAITHREVILISDVQWVELNGVEFSVSQISPIWFLKTVINRSISNLMLLSLGYMLGSIGYRLKKRTNILIFVVLPIVLIGCIVNSSIRGDQFIINLGLMIINTVVYLCENPMLITIIQIIGLGIFSFIGTKFLIKAPTNDYAHDLI
ncbi:MAG: hypothetical protein RSD36_09250 [Terrisporobacter sp.]